MLTQEDFDDNSGMRYEDYIYETQRKLEGCSRSRSGSLSTLQTCRDDDADKHINTQTNNTSLRSFKLRVESSPAAAAAATSQDRKRVSLNLSFPPEWDDYSDEPSSPDLSWSSTNSSIGVRSPGQHQHRQSLQNVQNTTRSGQQRQHQRARSSISDWNSMVIGPLSHTVTKQTNRRSGVIGMDSLSSPLTGSSRRSSNRWSSASSNSNRLSTLSSVTHLSEQDVILQERLQTLARTENAKLSESIDESVDMLAAKEEPERKLSDVYVMSSDDLSRLRLHDDDNDINEQYEEQNNTKNHRKNHEYETNDIDEDDDNNEYKEIIINADEEEVWEPGPTRPGNIGGTVLSWQMTGDIVRTSAQSAKSPREIVRLLKFVYAMFSRPENFELQVPSLLPPQQVVMGLRKSLPGWQEALYGIKSAGCTGFAMIVVALQMLLLALMLSAYTVGDWLSRPVQWYNKPLSRDAVLKKASAKAASKKRRRRGQRKWRTH